MDSLRGQSQVVRLDRHKSPNLQREERRIQSDKRVLTDDGIRDAITDRIEAVRQRIQSAKQSIRESASSIARNVRDYLTGEQAFTGTSHAVEQPRQGLERAVAEAQPTIDNMRQSQRYLGISR